MFPVIEMGFFFLAGSLQFPASLHPLSVVPLDFASWHLIHQSRPAMLSQSPDFRVFSHNKQIKFEVNSL